jgi:ABC transporter substrate binding protein
MEGIGLAHLYPALAWSVCAPGHHGYPRAPDLILRKALRGRLGHQITGATARPFLHFLNPTEIRQVIEVAGGASNGGLIVLPDFFTAANHLFIIASAAQHRAPAIYPYRYFAVDGGLMSYGVNTAEEFRRAATYVDRILRGASPGELPVQAPNKFEFVVNLKTATALGLTIPPTLVALADEVIE